MFDLYNREEFTKSIGKLIRAGIVIPLTKTHDNYEFILKFWTSYYIHSPRSTPPAFYKIHPSWTKIITELEPFLLKNDSVQNSLDQIGIDKRMDLFDRFTKTQDALLESQEELKRNSMGQCHECTKYINKDAVLGKDYHDFKKGVGLICDECLRRNPPEKRLEWMHPKK